MAKCIECGKEMYTSPASFKCFGCATGYANRTPTSRPVVPSDCVSKADLHKLALQYKAARDDYWKGETTEWRRQGDVYDKIYCELMELLEEPNDNP